MNDNRLILQSHTLVGALFHSDGPLWSIFFEMVASIAFIWMAKASTSSMLKICLAGLGAILIGGTLGAIVWHSHGLDTGKGWGTLNFFSGFPRVLYGFSCGVLLYKMPSELGFKDNSLKWPNLSTAGLYIALIGCLLFPHTFLGLFYLVVIVVVEPMLVWLGSNVTCTTTPFLAVSKFVGWLSYLCLHMPVLIAVYVIDEKYGIAPFQGSLLRSLR